MKDPHSRAPKKNTSRGNEVLPQDTTHPIQKMCYQWGSPCQDPAVNWTTRRPPDDRKEMQTAVVWSCFLFIRSGQNHFAKHSERGKKTRQTEEEVGRSGNGQAWSWASPRGQWRTGKNWENWLQNHLWCPNDPRGQGIDDDDDVMKDVNLAVILECNKHWWACWQSLSTSQQYKHMPQWSRWQWNRRILWPVTECYWSDTEEGHSCCARRLECRSGQGCLWKLSSQMWTLLQWWH